LSWAIDFLNQRLNSARAASVAAFETASESR